MRHLHSRMTRLALMLSLTLGLAAGCSGKKDTPEPQRDGDDGKRDGGKRGEGKRGGSRDKSPQPPGGTPANEDPEVLAYVKKKGWSLNRDFRISDLKPMIFLTVQNSEKPFEDVSITTDDYKMIARSKTVQVLAIQKVKNTDEGLKTVASIPQLEGIVVGGEDVTDAGIKALAGCKSLDNVTLMTKKVTDAGVKELAALPRLESLYLGFMTLTGSAFEAFAG